MCILVYLQIYGLKSDKETAASAKSTETYGLVVNGNEYAGEGS